MKKIIFIPLVLIGVIILGIVFMSVFKLCPPDGPWPTPPWCEEDSINIKESIEGLVRPQVTFNVEVPRYTPPEDIICIRTNIYYNIPMEKVSVNKWTVTRDFPPKTEINYAYNRNCVGYEAGEEIDSKDTQASWDKHRTFLSGGSKEFSDVVNKWRWFDENPGYIDNSRPVKNFVPRVNNFEFQDGLSVIDYWWSNFDENGETENTIKEIKETNAGFVMYHPTFNLEISGDDVKLVGEAESCGHCYDFEAVEYEISEARKQGLEVSLRAQVWTENNIPVKEYSPTFWDNLFAALEEYYVSIAEIAERNNVYAIGLGSDSDIFRALIESDYAPADKYERYDRIIQKVRAKYHGKLFYEFVATGPELDPMYPYVEKWNGLTEEFDFYQIGWWKAVCSGNDATYSQIQASISRQLDDLETKYEQTGKPFVLSLAFPSVDGGCKSSYEYAWNDERIDIWKPYGSIENDYQEQADVFEAFLNEAAERDWIIGIYPFGYWRHDSHDRQWNVRGKPTAEVFKKWYAII